MMDAPHAPGVWMTLRECVPELAPLLALLGALVAAEYAAYCYDAARAAARAARRGKLSRPGVVVVLTLVVFAFCGTAGYAGLALRYFYAEAYWLTLAGMLVLAPATLALIVWQRKTDAFVRLLTAEADLGAAAETLSLRSRLVSASFAHIHSAIYQVCEFCPDISGPLVGPDGERYDLRIVAATPGMRRYFHVPEDADVEGRNHYEVYPGIYDPTTGAGLRPDWLAHHTAALHNEPTTSGAGGDAFDGPEGRRSFGWALHPLLPSPDGTRAAGMLMEITDRTEVEALHREKRAAQMEVREANERALQAAGPLRKAARDL